METTYIRPKRNKKKVYSLAQKKAHILFQKEGVNYIPVENVQGVRYANGVYYITLRSDGLLLMKVKTE